MADREYPLHIYTPEPDDVVEFQKPPRNLRPKSAIQQQASTHRVAMFGKLRVCDPNSESDTLGVLHFPERLSTFGSVADDMRDSFGKPPRAPDRIWED